MFFKVNLIKRPRIYILGLILMNDDFLLSVSHASNKTIFPNRIKSTSAPRPQKSVTISASNELKRQLPHQRKKRRYFLIFCLIETQKHPYLCKITFYHHPTPSPDTPKHLPLPLKQGKPMPPHKSSSYKAGARLKTAP